MKDIYHSESENLMDDIKFLVDEVERESGGLKANEIIPYRRLLLFFSSVSEITASWR